MLHMQNAGNHNDRWYGRLILVYWVLTPQQQLGSYRDMDYDDEMSVSLVEETGAPGEDYRPTAST